MGGKSAVSVFGFPLGHYSKSTQLAICTTGVFFFFLVHDYLQELITRAEKFHFGLFLTLMEFSSCAFFPYLFSSLRRSPLPAPTAWRSYIYLSAMLLASVACANASLKFVNFPIKVVFKSCKLIPTMIVGVLLLSKSFSLKNYLSAFLLCMGLVGFTLADAQNSSTGFSLDGVLLLTCSVVLDATIPNFQEKVMNSSPFASSEQVMMYTNLIGLGFLSVLLVLTGELFDAIVFLSQPQHFSVILYLALFSLVAYTGVSFYMALVHEFGGVFAVALTTIRKVLTVVLSFVLFPKQFSTSFLYSGLCVVAGLMLSASSKKHGHHGQSTTAAPDSSLSSVVSTSIPTSEFAVVVQPAEITPNNKIEVCRKE
eukprot:TRINITY_DN16544_c0_g1_i2.p1 TRINITY_DN16544_c0_g1~~TRINITY_DN16544_c0_g1_i2.p1  ORF type:complete len:409 (-),score=36.62 TRINITY_DN16544_c0_g1_i2:35-1138(-)